MNERNNALWAAGFGAITLAIWLPGSLLLAGYALLAAAAWAVLLLVLRAFK